MADGPSTDTAGPSNSIGPSLTTTQFWALMERSQVADTDALQLQLIGFAGKIGKSGKRPRFRFLPVHQRATAYLEIDTALQTVGQSADWLRKKIGGAPFKRAGRRLSAKQR
jgi:hypothetical protein